MSKWIYIYICMYFTSPSHGCCCVLWKPSPTTHAREKLLCILWSRYAGAQHMCKINWHTSWVDNEIIHREQNTQSCDTSAYWRLATHQPKCDGKWKHFVGNTTYFKAWKQSSSCLELAHTYDEYWCIRTVVFDFWVPLWSDVFEWGGGDDGEAD